MQKLIIFIHKCWSFPGKKKLKVLINNTIAKKELNLEKMKRSLDMIYSLQNKRKDEKELDLIYTMRKRSRQVDLIKFSRLNVKTMQVSQSLTSHLI